ncbi:MAG: GH116 family glycosyl hydrolase [Gemmatimonadales bacterium]
MTLRVAFVSAAGAEREAVLAWLPTVEGIQMRRYEPGHLEAAVSEADVVWIHATRPALFPTDAIRAFLAQGGGLLLTLQAAELVGPLGLETVPPNDRREEAWSHHTDEWWSEELREMKGYPHVRGVATYGPHPLVDGLHNGTFCWAPIDGETYAWACYSGGVWPVDGRVVGVERAYIVQNPERVVAWEYAIGRGRVLCIGAYTYFAAPDRLLRPQLERLVANALHAASAAPAQRSWWPLPGTAATVSEGLILPERLELDGALPIPTQDAIALAGPVQEDEQFDLAGRRALLVGREQRGIRELWVHPHRTVAWWTVRADGEVALGTQIEVGPNALGRTLETAGRRVLETSFLALEHAILLVDYRPERKRRESVGRGPADFEIELVLDLRRMWPFAAGCGGNLRYRAGSDGRVAMVESESDDGVAGLFLSRPGRIEMTPMQGDVPAVRCVIRTPLGAPLTVAVVGGASRDDFERTLRGVRRLGVEGLVRQRVQRSVTLAEARLVVRADDRPFERAFEWAKRRLDAFLGDTPGVGRSLLAGYAPSKPGWGDGRPGYAWFFGRDACWTAFALLAAGEFSVPRQVIRFLGDRQDVNGKVLHEATTSGQFHYDAADATPLFLLLVARYLAWTGDREFVASVWPHVERAYGYCLSTDSDGDGLIENARVGHGWIESGPLGGAKVTGYLSAIWYAALQGLARTAEVLEHKKFAAECWARAARVTAVIEDRFYDAERGSYALDIRPDGTPTWTETALQAVPLFLGSANPVRARAYLERLGGKTFNSRWGVRLVPTGDPLFSRQGYHAGTVWPLFTGWAALAEYKAGLGEAGFAHLTTNADLASARQRGAFDEALDGLEEQPAGVCPDQAWSAGMVVLPFVEGLLGVEPDAPGGRLAIRPQLPSAWARLEAEGLRCGESAYDLKIQRRDDGFSIALRRTLGPGLFVTLAPWCPTLPLRVEVDGEAVKPDTTGWGSGLRCAVSLEAAGEHEVRFVLK